MKVKIEENEEEMQGNAGKSEENALFTHLAGVCCGSGGLSDDISKNNIVIAEKLCKKQ